MKLLAFLIVLTSVWAQKAAQAPLFEVATIKSPAVDWRGGRFIRMESGNQFVARNHTLKSLLAAAYNLSPQAIFGSPDWMDSERWDIVARTPGETRPKQEERMAMLRALLVERFGLAFHRELKIMPVFTLMVAKGGPKLRESKTDLDAALISTVYPDYVMLPARNASMAEFVWMLQRAVVNRPVLDRTGLVGRFDFELEWTPDDTQFGGQLPKETAESAKRGLYGALQQQLGLKLEAGKGPVETLVIDGASRPSAN